MQNQKVVVGQILKAQGIKGEIKVKPLCDDPERFFELKEAEVEGLGRCRVLNCRLTGGFAFLYLDKLYNRDLAESVAGKYLVIDREEVDLPEGRFLIADVIGCRVEFEDGTVLGVLDDILQTYAIDTYSVRCPDGRKVLFPAVGKAVVAIEPERERVVLCRKGFEEVCCYED